ncbi:MAG TPA: transposase, partial [Polyangiaceae bacterium]|nr:transposase [Polyangiaceae bacterium]
MEKRKRRKFTAEFKADAVRLCTTGGKTIAEVTKQFDLTETALREWVRRAAIDAASGPADALTTAERLELKGRPLGARGQELVEVFHAALDPSARRWG